VPSTRCPDCDTLREITPTDQPVGRTGTARRWRVVMHPAAPAEGVEPGICDGSGKLV
jgi:hypothetical protein